MQRLYATRGRMLSNNHLPTDHHSFRKQAVLNGFFQSYVCMNKGVTPSAGCSQVEGLSTRY